MSNYMERIAQMLEVELEEEFEVKVVSGISEYGITKVKEIENSYFKITTEGLYRRNKKEHIYYDSSPWLKGIFLGKVIIKRPPWKPKMSERYWTFRLEDNEVEVFEDTWYGDDIDIIEYRLGFCYKTEEGARANLPKAEKFFKSDEVINWEGC